MALFTVNPRFGAFLINIHVTTVNTDMTSVSKPSPRRGRKKIFFGSAPANQYPVFGF